MTDFAKQLLDWFDESGRKDLPWQHNVSPYRVWVSEIMLQQTQVATVIPYFGRFLERFPDVESLAKAPIDDVLAMWTGLGYYARARNLHRTAVTISEAHHGRFPEDVALLQTLPGIGRSTAGAIVSIACGKRAPILDGNVKRVLSRYGAVSGWPGKQAVATQLWRIAEQHTPYDRVADYTQAIMDLGATVCTRTRPNCDDCPVQEQCLGWRCGNPTQFPGRKPKRVLPERQRYYLVVRDMTGSFLLERRPASGIWGGLWCFPEFSTHGDLEQWCRVNLGQYDHQFETAAPLVHTFTHFRLTMTLVALSLESERPQLSEESESRWYDREGQMSVGLPAPVVAYLRRLTH